MRAEEQKAFFEDQGYLIVEHVLSDRELSVCREEIDCLHQVAADLEAKGDPAYGHFQREPYANQANRNDGLPVLRKIENTRNFSDVFRKLAAHPKLVQAVHRLVGPDLLLFRSTLMLKPAFHGSVHGLHQDSAYWPMEPPTLVTVSIALTDATVENGCFKVIPGSHHWGMQEWGGIAREQGADLTDRKDISQDGQIDVPLSAGSALCFHSLMVHGSGPNRSPHPRHTALFAYFSPKVRYVPGEGQAREKTFPVITGLDGREELTLVAEE
jgi:ectoine hydroxylase-related dioxygenase (phytanoyl-CoA dioxygenase family)